VVPVVPEPFTPTTSNLFITPAEAETGETVTINVLVTNTGDVSGTHRVTLKIDNVVVDTEDVTLESGARRTVTFITSRDEAGTYAVDVNGLPGEFEVIEGVPLPPEPTAVNWWLISSIIAAAVVIAVVVLLVMRQAGG